MPRITLDISKGYMPDLMLEDILAAGGLAKATNVLPIAGNYLPLSGKVTYNNTAVSGTPLQGIYAQESDGDYHNFLGTSTKLYRFTKSLMTDVSKAVTDTTISFAAPDTINDSNSGLGIFNAGDTIEVSGTVSNDGTYTVDTVAAGSITTVEQTIVLEAAGSSFTIRVVYSATNWDFTVYGDWLVATDYEYDIQVLKGIGTGTTYADLGGTPPKAKYSLMNHGHLVLGFVNSGTAAPKKIQWSAKENIESWTADLATGADSQDFPEMIGVITGLANIGEAFGIFAEDSITIGYYIEGGYTYGFKQNAVKNIGCFYPASLVSIGDLVFFWSRESVWMWNGSGYPTEIGVNLKRTLFAAVDTGNANRISVAHDRINSLVIWAYPSTTSDGTPDKMVAYNYNENRWTGPIDISCELLMLGSTGGFTINELTSTLINNETTHTIDSRFWIGDDLQLLVVDDSDSKAKTLTGTPLEAEIETGEYHDNDQVYMITKAFPPVDGLAGSGSVAVKHRYSILDTSGYGAESSIKSDGSADLRTSNRRIGLNVKATNFSRIGKQITIEGGAVGRR